MPTNYVIDYETLRNCTILVVEEYKRDVTKVFIIHKLTNQLKELLEFFDQNIKDKEWHVSFNGLAFDSQITEFIIRNRERLLTLSGEQIAMEIYDKAQSIITRQENGEWNEFSEKDLKIRHLDVFKLNHWDNPAKRSSLKWIQYSMDWFNIQEMPIHHSTLIKTWKEIHTIISYCRNDVKSTKNIMELSKEQIALRGTLSQEYKLPLYSASEPRISKELFMLFLSQKTGIPKYELRQMRTNRDKIRMNDLILPYTNFKTKTFQDLLANFRSVVINAKDTKGGFKYSLNYKGVKTDFGLGGVHGCKSSGVYEGSENRIIMTSDVKSFYPNLAIRNKWSPAHLPQAEFCELYEWFYDERLKIPKKDPKNYVYKIILNSTYGLSNDKNSFLYDPEFTMRVTINGQLTLMMLYEMLAEGIPDAEPLMQNTDGLEMIIPESYKDRYLEICKEWEKITNLELEHDEYKKIIIGDVNNYIAVPVKGKAKCKGRFEYENLALNKNKSFLAIPKALFEYFVNDVLPEQSLAANNSIYDYCAGVKIKGDWKFQQICTKFKIPTEYTHYSILQKREFLKKNGWEQSWSDDNWVRSDASNKEANTGIPTEAAFTHTIKKITGASVIKEDLQKTLRYFISNNGCKVIKTNTLDGREIQVESGKWKITEMNEMIMKPNLSDYNIDLSYYTDKVYKEIANILGNPNKQMSLF